MIGLTDESLAVAASKIKELLNDPADKLSVRPTKLLFRPADLDLLDMTVEDVVKMVEAQEKLK